MECRRLFSVGLAGIVTAIMILSAFGTMNAKSTVVETESKYMLVHFPMLPSEATQEAVESSGAHILSYMGEGNYLVRIQGNIPSLLSMISDMISVYPASAKVSSELDSLTGMQPIRVTLHEGEDVAQAVAALESYSATIVKVHDISAPYILCIMDANKIPYVASMNQVSAIHPNPEPQTHMNLITSNTYMGVDAAQVGSFRGSGMLAQVQDNGCDADVIVGSGLGHQDLDGVIYTDGNPVEDDHGTCTTGIVFGSGAGDITAQGIAYQATGSFADWGTGRTTSVANLWNGNFEQGSAGMNGVMQSNSWSSGTLDGTYTAYSSEDDAAAFAYPHVLTLWAAGNSNSGTGVGLITQDSANKNGMCIGAIFHLDTASMADDNYHDAGTGMTPSRGPAADGRMKPDMCAAFDAIYTVDQVGTAGYASGSYYTDFGGTSGATPTVAGCSLLAYEMYKENYFGNNPTTVIPYSSTIKALMIADAYQYPIGTNAITRNVEGWGTPDMEKMYNLGSVYHQFDEYPQAMSSGSVWTRQVYADAVNPLKITLCWIDPAAPSTTGTGRALINNLDLKVTSPGGVIYYGNNGLWTNIWSASGTGVNDWSRSSSYRDDENNVENVFIQTPQTGIWTIEVSGRTGDVAQGPQHFSLVSSGAKIPISSAGTIDIEDDMYPREATVTIVVKDRDLNTNTGTAQTVNVNLKSVAEPAGETTLLTETGPDTSTFQGTKTISATNAAGVVWVNAADTITATYNDANDGSGSPAVATDTATVDGTAPTAPSGLTVEWYGFGTNPGTATLTTTGTTQAGGPHNVWFTIVDSNAGTELTTPNSVAEFTDVYYTNAGTSNDVRAGPSSAPPVGDYEFLKCQYATTVSPSTVNNITLTFEGYFSAALTATMFAWDGSAWDSLGSAAISTTDTTMSILVTNDPGQYIVGGNVLWGVWAGTARRSCTVDFLRVLINYEVPYTTMDDNTMNWTASASADVDHYNVYRSDTQTGTYTLAGSSPVGTNTYQDDGRGMGDATLWWYRVRAVDTAGNEEPNTVSVPEGVFMPSYQINLAGKSANSWVFVSFPSGLSGTIQTVLNDATAGDGLTTWSVAKWYNPATPADPWKSYRVGGTANDMPTITNAMGVWLWITANGGDQALTLGSYVSVPASTGITLNVGWNLVGYPSMTDRLGSTLPSQVDMLSAYSASATYTDYIGAAIDAITLHHGNAYFMHATANVLWTVTNP